MQFGLFGGARSRGGGPIGDNQGGDSQGYRDYINYVREAEDLGFDWVMAVEHHFTDYAAVPDNAQVMSFVAGKTKSIGVFPAAFILPWNDPLRVADRLGPGSCDSAPRRLAKRLSLFQRPRVA